MVYCRKKLVNNLKSSIFCGTKGFLTFNLAFLSYLEYSLHNNTKLKEGAAFGMKRNVVPFGEMIAIPLFFCFVLPAMVGNISLIECALICAALMVATCFVVRTFYLREKLLKKMTNNENYTEEQIEQEFKKDTIKFPIFDKNRQHIEYNSPNPGQLMNESPPSLFVKVLLFPLTIFLKALQSCIMISLAAVELLEAVPSFCVDVVFDRGFASTQSNMKRSAHLLYASVRNLVPVTKLDECVADFIGKPEERCCQ
ncbi:MULTISPECIES: hypothetical protein [unclassified Wolbachia]|uniref:hypothetical protein n=1 Tax=unclassified Wolbachia TaxID=2640676 RepID=UPI0001761ED7|nr:MULTISPECIES: hypothetical protein [unclassified Wolbachia]QEK89348.1 hypothetical protein CAI20_01140 [Wolbachia endosymbiont of Chrysomya megacephala]CAQ54858.1 Putative membrane protein [Wolbachia endosymbiont of Culex quinquefasciatus Pel]CQD09065.1 Uncharacterised protein [Wolbachia endosymbiont wPip_Mol of Culex molestus]